MEENQDYSKYEVGKKFDDGTVIKHIFMKAKEYIVLENQEGDIRYGFNDRPQLESEISKELLRAHNEFTKTLGGGFREIYDHQITWCLVHIFGKIFSEQDVEYKVGDGFKEFYDFIKEQERDIKNILFSSKSITIYESKNGNARVKISGETNANWYPLIQEFRQLASFTNIYKGKAKDRMLSRLAVLLGQALTTNDIHDNIFESIRKRVLSRNIAFNRFKFLGVALGFFLLFVIVYLIIDFPCYYTDYSNAAFFGGLGAFISLIGRASSIATDPLESNLLLYLQAVVKILLGFIFGVIAIMLINADLMLTEFKDNDLAISIIAIVSGISERLIPDTLKKFDTSDQPET